MGRRVPYPSGESQEPDGFYRVVQGQLEDKHDRAHVTLLIPPNPPQTGGVTRNVDYFSSAGEAD
jgi:hypothetical protein